MEEKMKHDPIAYTYETNIHCPKCAEERFGRGIHGFIAEDSYDSEGNLVGVVPSWDSWCNQEWDEFPCGSCGQKLGYYKTL